jgi:hypothetical protein
MKKLLLTTMLVSAVCLFFNSCTKTALTAGKCSISCDASGDYTKSYSSNNTASTVSKGLIIQMLASNLNITDQVAWTIVLPTDIKAGTYNMKDQGSNPTAFGFVSVKDNIGYGADEAGGFTFTITKIDDAGVEGTFQGKMLEDGSTNKTCTVSNGKFKAVF